MAHQPVGAREPVSDGTSASPAPVRGQRLDEIRMPRGEIGRLAGIESQNRQRATIAPGNYDPSHATVAITTRSLARLLGESRIELRIVGRC